MCRALAGMLLASLNSALLGAYVVLRRMAFLSTAITHTILPGIVFAFLAGISLYWGALGAALLTSVSVGCISNSRRLHEDTAIGVAFSFMFALGVLLMALTNKYRDFQSMLFGNALLLSGEDLWMIGSITVVIFLMLALFHKGLELSSYDEEYACQCGMEPGRLRLLLLALVALSTVSCVKLVGALLTTALLITPAATAVMVARTLPGVMFFSVLFGVGSALAGLILTFYWFEKVPTGATTVMVCSLVFLVVFAGRWLVMRLRTALPVS